MRRRHREKGQKERREINRRTLRKEGEEDKVSLTVREKDEQVTWGG